MSRFSTEDDHGTQGIQTFKVVVDNTNLVVTFFNGLDGDQVLRCDGWLYLEYELAIAFAEAFARANQSNTGTSRRSNWQNLNLGFVAWVRDNYPPQALSFPDLDIKLFNAFDRWISEKDEFGKYLLATSTALHWRSAIIGVVNELKLGPHKSRLPKTCRLRKALFARSEAKVEKTEPFDLPTFSRLLAAIRTEMLESYRYFNRREALFSEGRRLLTRVDDYHSAGVKPLRESSLSTQQHKALLLARLQRDFGATLPSLEDIKSASPARYDDIQDYGADAIYSFMHPSVYQLLPFAYQLAIFTAFNPSTLQGLKLDDGIKIQTVLGAERILFRSYKVRVKQYVTQSYIATDERFGPAHIVRSMTNWTVDIRKIAPPLIKDDFWLFVPRYNAVDRGVRSMRQDPMRGINFDVNNAILKFQKRHGLPRVGFQRIRATVASLAHDLFGGDIRAVMDFLQHQRSSTTLNNYTHGLGSTRHTQVIATVQNVRERWVTSNGQIDPRVLAETGDPGAATPGWQCADPYNSPIQGVRKERLCDAYGSCPICPHARVDLSSPVAYARIRQVEETLAQAKTVVLPERWAQGLSPIYQAITKFWLPGFPTEVVAQAKLVYTRPIVPFD